MSTLSIFTFASDDTGNNYYNSALMLNSDTSWSNFALLAKDALVLSNEIIGFDKSSHEDIVSLSKLLVNKHSNWLGFIELSDCVKVEKSAVFNLDNGELETFEGRFNRSLKLTVIEFSKAPIIPVFLYVTKEVGASDGGLAMERIELDGHTSEVDELVQSLIRTDSVIEVILSHQGDLMIGAMNPDLLLEKLEKPRRAARHFQ